MNDKLVSLTDATLESAKTCGGKFVGLFQIREFIKDFSSQYHLDFKIPQTYGIPGYNVYMAPAGGIPDIMRAANTAMKLCGGNVAVRSSGNIEDAAGQTFSGCFESVLNVKNTVELENAVYKVLMSLANNTVLEKFSPHDLSMGIVIQEMISHPDKAGVAYSEGFDRQPYIPISYDNNKLADKLVAGKESGKSFILMKYTQQTNPDGTCKGIRILPDMVNNPKYDIYHYNGDVKLMTQQQIRANQDLINVACFANATEQYFNHAVDIEFALKDGVSYILQQRPYILPTFEFKKFDEYGISIYNPKQPIIKGNVLILNNEFDTRQSDIVILKQDGLITIQKNAYKDLMQMADNQKAKYDHHGNQKRENIDKSSMVIIDNPYFPGDIKNGDYMELNLMTGQLKILRQNAGR